MNGDSSVPAHGEARAACVIYGAKSSPDERGSIADQIQRCREYAAQQAWDVEEVHTDEAASAYSSSRGPGLAAAKEAAARIAAERGGCVLLAYASDRLARGDGEQAAHLVEVFLWARRSGVTLAAVTEELGDLLYAALLGERAHADSKAKSAHTQRGIRQRVEAGHYFGSRSPFGYRFERDRNDKRDPGRLVVVPDEVAVVRRIYAAYVGGAGDARIALDLNRDGVRAPRAGRWDKSQVANMLRSPVYTGHVLLNGVVYRGAHDGIVDPELWERAQRQRAARRESVGGGRGRLPAGSHLLTRGLLRCACGAPMSARSFRHRPGLEVYVCARRRQTGGHELCQQSQVPREAIDNAVLAYFGSVGLDEEATLAQLWQADVGRLSEAQALREQAELELRHAEERLTRVRRDYTDGKISAEDWHSLRGELEPELSAAEASLAQHEARESAAEDDAASRDVEAQTLEQLARVRAAVAGQVSSAEDVDALRAALTELFSTFTLRRTSNAPAHVAVWPELALGEYFIEPTVRPDAVIFGPAVMPWADFESPDEPVPLEEALRRGIKGPIEYELRRTPLVFSPGGDRTSALSAGTNRLLGLGAAPLTTPADVLRAFGIEPGASTPPSLGEPATRVLTTLADGAAAIDDLVQLTGLDAAAAAAALSELELLGLVAEGDGLYRRTAGS